MEILDRRAFRPVRTALHVLDALHRLHPKEFTFSKACAMIGRVSLEAELKGGAAPDRILAGWEKETQPWIQRRAQALLY